MVGERRQAEGVAVPRRIGIVTRLFQRGLVIGRQHLPLVLARVAVPPFAESIGAALSFLARQIKRRVMVGQIGRRWRGLGLFDHQRANAVGSKLALRHHQRGDFLPVNVAHMADARSARLILAEPHIRVAVEGQGAANILVGISAPILDHHAPHDLAWAINLFHADDAHGNRLIVVQVNVDPLNRHRDRTAQKVSGIDLVTFDSSGCSHVVHSALLKIHFLDNLPLGRDQPDTCRAVGLQLPGKAALKLPGYFDDGVLDCLNRVNADDSHR